MNEKRAANGKPMTKFQRIVYLVLAVILTPVALGGVWLIVYAENTLNRDDKEEAEIKELLVGMEYLRSALVLRTSNRDEKPSRDELTLYELAEDRFDRVGASALPTIDLDFPEKFKELRKAIPVFLKGEGGTEEALRTIRRIVNWSSQNAEKFYPK